MKPFQGVTSTILSVLLGAGLCLGARARASEALSAQDRVRQAVQQSCAPELAATGCLVGEVERVQRSGDVHEYRFKMKVGPGEHDVIGLHRVVRESAPWTPVRAAKSVFLVHGDAWGFDGVYTPFATFLASGGVDVWGIDLRWVNVPAGTTDFRFMKGWNLGMHVHDVRTGLAVARTVRWAGGGEGGRMNLLGWSRAALVAYATANLETRLPPALRHVGGLIPVDMVLEYAPEDGLLRERACARHARALVAYRNNHQYEGGLLGPAPGLMLQTVGTLAASHPGGNELSPSLTNRQLALVLGAATFTNGDALTPVPFYHLVGGPFDAAPPLPTGLTWTPESAFFSLLQRAAPYQGFAEVVESEALLCGAPDLPYDDHLADISVPVLYVGAAGGFGTQGLHGLSLLGSTDRTVRLVRFFPDEARAQDYGHADLFLATNAAEEVWTPILQWIQAR